MSGCNKSKFITPNTTIIIGNRSKGETLKGETD